MSPDRGSGYTLIGIGLSWSIATDHRLQQSYARAVLYGDVFEQALIFIYQIRGFVFSFFRLFVYGKWLVGMPTRLGPIGATKWVNQNRDSIP